MRPIRFTSDVVFPLYKFTKRAYIPDFLRYGKLKLGTLFGYAQAEVYKVGVHDRHEGYYARRVPEEKSSDGVPQIHLTIARNNFVFCVSDIYDDALYEEFDADCCLRIRHRGFFDAIDEVLTAAGINHPACTSALVRKVRYYQKGVWAELPTDVDFAGVFKDASFKNQHEVRALWEPVDPPPEHLAAERRLTPERINHDRNFLLSMAEDEWYQDLSREYCKWLPETFISAPNAVNYCEVFKTKLPP